MKRRNICVILLVLLVIACESKRPEANGVFTVTLEGRSILTGATVTVLKEGTTDEVAAGTTDEEGLFTIEKIATASTLKVTVCGGKFYSIGAGGLVSFNGCLFAVVPVKETGKERVFIDFVSTLAATYDSATAKTEVLNYLALTADSAATEETTLTDATKRYLWQQALSVIAAQIADANGITPETSLSTEALFTLVLADLADNNTIDGSTGAKFGPVLPVGEALIRQFLSNAVSGVSPSFTAADLADWVTHLQTAKADFLGAGGEDPDDLTDPDTDGTGSDSDEENLYPDYDTVGNPPGIEIKSPANNAVLYNIVTVKAQRTLDSCPLLSVACTLKSGDFYTKELTDTHPNTEIFEASIDTLDLELADEQFTLICIGSDGIKQAQKSVKFTLANHNPVTVIPYVTGKVTAVAGVAVYDAEGNKIKTLTETAGSVTGDLPPGEYSFTVTGGDYTSILFTSGTGDPKVVTLSTPLRSRAIIEAGATTTVYVTPLTTIREIIVQGLTEKGGRTPDEAIDDSLALFETHYLDGLNPYAKPQAGQPAENATLNWVAIAALEQLAADIAAAKGLSRGAVLMDDILTALAADLLEPKVLFNGIDKNDDPLKIKTFAVDSYLFRYHYAVALKRFIEEETEYTYQDFQNLIYNIAMDTSELFPKQDEPIEVVAKAPQIKNLAFKRAADAGFIDYAAPDTIPFVKDALDLRFFVEMADSATIDLLDLYFVEGTPILSLDDLTESSGTYTATGIMVDGADGEKTLTIRAEDDQNNYGTRTVTIVKDSVSPVVTLTPPVAEVIAGDISFDYAVTEERLASEHYTIQPLGGTLTTHPLANPALSGNILLSEIEDDGTYTVSFYAVDKAANTGSASFTRTKDTTPPTATITVKTVEETPRLLPTATKWVNANDFSINFSGVTDRPGSELTYRYSVRTGAAQQNATHTTTVSSWESTQYLGNLPDSNKADLLNTKHIVTGWVVDAVGNETSRQETEIYVDTVAPTMTVSDAPSNPVNAFTFVYTATDINMKRVWIVDQVGATTITTEGQSGTRNYTVDCLSGAEEGAHVVNFNAIDEAGQSVSVQKVLYIDCTPPVFNGGESPFAETNLEEDGRYLNQTDNLFLSLDRPGTIYYEYFLSGSLYPACSGSAPYTDTSVKVSCPFDDAGANDGVYTIKIYAFDLAGNKSLTDFIRTFTIDNIAPAFTRATESKTKPWNPYTTTGGTTIQYTATDTNFDQCVFSLNSVDVSTFSPSSITGGTSTLDLWLKGLDLSFFQGDKENSVSAYCTDKAGNVSTRAFNWFFDVTMPVTTILSTSPTIPNLKVLNTSPMTVNLKMTDNGVTLDHTSVDRVYCQWSSSASPDWQYCTDGGSSGKAVTYNSGDGSYRASFAVSYSQNNVTYNYRFFARDSALNQDAESAGVSTTFKFDNVAPLLSIVAGQSEYTSETVASYVIKFDTPFAHLNGLQARAIQSGVERGSVNCYSGIPSVCSINPDWFFCLDNQVWTCDITGLPGTFNGYVYFKAKDLYGNGNFDFSSLSSCSNDGNNPCLQRKLVVDANPPSVSVTLDAASKYISANEPVVFSFSSGGTVTSRKCSIAAYSGTPPILALNDVTTPFDCVDGTVTIPYSTISSLSDGKYYVKVVVTNANGSNMAMAPFIIDRIAPAVTALSANVTKLYYNPGDSIGFTFDAQDTGSLIRHIKIMATSRRYFNNSSGTVDQAATAITLYDADVEPDYSYASVTASIPAGITGGEYTAFTIEVADAAGNFSSLTKQATQTLRIKEAAESTGVTVVASRVKSVGPDRMRLQLTRMKMDTYSDPIVKSAIFMKNSQQISINSYSATPSTGFIEFCPNGGSYENTCEGFIPSGGTTPHVFYSPTYTKETSRLFTVKLPEFKTCYSYNPASLSVSRYFFLPKESFLVVTDNFGFVRNIAITDDISQSDCPSLSVKRRYCEKTGSSYTLYHCTDSLDESEWCLKKAEYLTKSECDDLLRRATQW